MKAIILAAGEGTRLRPLTDNKPKCMVEYKNKPIIDHIIDCMNQNNINDIAVVAGYKKDVLEEHLKNRDVIFYDNHKYDSTNMVTSLFCAEEYMDDDVIISYADIVYDKGVLKKLMDFSGDIGVVVDKDWRQLWEKRMDDPLSDAETLKLRDGVIYELGKKPNSYNEIEGQYIGLIKISANAAGKVRDFYNSLDRNSEYDGKDFNNMYMTSFIQMIIDDLTDVKPVFIKGGWLEIDTLEDLKAYDG